MYVFLYFYFVVLSIVVYRRFDLRANSYYRTVCTGTYRLSFVLLALPFFFFFFFIYLLRAFELEGKKERLR